jgi:hypothetical protein
MSQIRNKARKFAAMIGLCGVAFVAVPLAGTSVSASTAPVFTLSTNIETVEQCASLVGYTMISTGGAVTSYSISPAAPKGLTFSAATGLLSGKPEVVAASSVYSITGTNSVGSLTKFFTLTVTAPTATGIYPTCQKVTGTVGVALTPTTKYSDVGLNNEYNFSISPALPAGLTINELTGVISGTPTKETSMTDMVFTVRMDEEDTDWTSFVTITMTISPAAAATTTTAVAPTTTTTVAPTTTTTVAVAKKTTIVCTKGSTVKRVTALKPKCPAGYKKKTK